MNFSFLKERFGAVADVFLKGRAGKILLAIGCFMICALPYFTLVATVQTNVSYQSDAMHTAVGGTFFVGIIMAILTWGVILTACGTFLYHIFKRCFPVRCVRDAVVLASFGFCILFTLLGVCGLPLVSRYVVYGDKWNVVEVSYHLLRFIPLPEASWVFWGAHIPILLVAIAWIPALFMKARSEGMKKSFFLLLPLFAYVVFYVSASFLTWGRLLFYLPSLISMIGFAIISYRYLLGAAPSNDEKTVVQNGVFHSAESKKEKKQSSYIGKSFIIEVSDTSDKK